MNRNFQKAVQPRMLLWGYGNHGRQIAKVHGSLWILEYARDEKLSEFLFCSQHGIHVCLAAHFLAGSSAIEQTPHVRGKVAVWTIAIARAASASTGGGCRRLCTRGSCARARGGKRRHVGRERTAQNQTRHGKRIGGTIRFQRERIEMLPVKVHSRIVGSIGTITTDDGLVAKVAVGRVDGEHRLRIDCIHNEQWIVIGTEAFCRRVHSKH